MATMNDAQHPDFFITPCAAQPAPDGAPAVVSPCLAHMSVPLFYPDNLTHLPKPWHHDIYCAEPFAQTILATLDRLLAERGLGLVHLGIYNPRQARHRDGTPIQPPRWSNHAYGSAIDFWGVVLADGTPMPWARMKKFGVLTKSIPDQCGAVLAKAGLRPEIVDESSWLHLGYFPPR